MPILRIYDAWELDHDGTKSVGGSRSAPVEIEIDGQFIDRDFSLAASTTLDVWSSADAITDFDFLWFKADQDLRVELTVDRGNEVGDELLALLVEANTPFRLVYDDALALYTANFAAGTADVVDRVRIRNAGSSTANGRFFIAT